MYFQQTIYTSSNNLLISVYVAMQSAMNKVSLSCLSIYSLLLLFQTLILALSCTMQFQFQCWIHAHRIIEDAQVVHNRNCENAVFFSGLLADTTWSPSTWNIHTPGRPILLVELRLRTASVPEPLTVKYLIPSPALKPAWAGLASRIHPSLFPLPLLLPLPLHESAVAHWRSAYSRIT